MFKISSLAILDIASYSKLSETFSIATLKVQLRSGLSKSKRQINSFNVLASD